MSKPNLPIVAAMLDGSILVEVSETEVREPTEAERDEIARRCNIWARAKETIEAAITVERIGLGGACELVEQALQIMEGDQ